MADLNVSLILRLVDKATAPARAAMRAIERMGGAGFQRQAEVIGRGSRMIAGGLGTIAGTATRTLGVLTDYRTMLAGLGLGAVANGFIKTAAEFESYNVQLTNLEGSSEGAKKAMAWIETFATKTPLQMDQAVNAYAKLKAFGIDPTNGSLQAMVDTMAATGGGAEKLDGMVLALGQAWTKGKLQGEEAMQLLERGVPVWDILSKKLGKTTAEVMKMSEKGQLGREEIQLLMDALGEANAGASEEMSKTWDGIVSNLWDYWAKFQRMVMSSGLFRYLKDKLEGILDLLNRMAANGDLQRWAERVGASVQAGLEALWSFGGGLVEVWKAVSPWINSAADAVGGFGNAALIVIGLRFSTTILALTGAFFRLSAGVLVVGSTALPVLTGALNAVGAAAIFVSTTALRGLLGMLGMLGAVATAVATTSLTLLTGALGMVGRAVVALASLATAHPLVALATALAAAALLIYQNWDSVVRVFKDVFAAADRFFKYVTGWSFSEITAAIKGAFDIDWVQIGADMMTSIWAGFKSIMGQFGEWMKASLLSFLPDLSNYIPGTTTGPVAGAPNRALAYKAAMSPEMQSRVMGGRATGGPVRHGGIYRWQEQGTELFSPTTDGVVINARQTRVMAGGGARSTAIHLGGITIHAAQGQSPQAIAREVRREMERLAREGGFGLHDGGAYV